MCVGYVSLLVIDGAPYFTACVLNEKAFYRDQAKRSDSFFSPTHQLQTS